MLHARTCQCTDMTLSDTAVTSTTVGADAGPRDLDVGDDDVSKKRSEFRP